MAPHLQAVLKAIQHLFSKFSSLVFRHVFRELNEEVDLLSKQALILQPSRLIITDVSSAKEEALSK